MSLCGDNELLHSKGYILPAMSSWRVATGDPPVVPVLQVPMSNKGVRLLNVFKNSLECRDKEQVCTAKCSEKTTIRLRTLTSKHA